MYLASDSERACSKADTCLVLMADAGIGRSEGESLVGKNTECAESDEDCENTVVDFEAVSDWPSR